MIYATKTSKTH